MTQSNAKTSLKNTIAIVGPTASGKSALGLALAKHFAKENKSGEIINCDSVQVYKDFNIGSAKASLEEQREVPHHLLDLVSWNENFDASRFREHALKSIEAIEKRSHTPIIVGGTGLYFRALCGEKFHELPSDSTLRKELDSLDNETLYKKLQSLDPQRAKELHPNDRFRVGRACEIAMLTGKSLASFSEVPSKNNEERPFTILCHPPREMLLKIIEKRSQKLLDDGLIEEVRSLLKAGCPSTAKPMQSIGYLQVCEYLEKGNIGEKELLGKIIIATRQYARKQLMWFRKVPIDVELKKPYDLSTSVTEILRKLRAS